MKKVNSQERHDWKPTAESLGFKFHTVNGEKYWDESHHYEFTLKQIEEDIEAPTEEIHEMCMDMVDRVVGCEELLTKLHIPCVMWDRIKQSWIDQDTHLYGRMDFAYYGSGPVKLYELNYDTPTSLYESAFFQWVWMEQMRQRGYFNKNVDQFNSIQDNLMSAFHHIKLKHGFSGDPTDVAIHFASVKEHEEDLGTTRYLQDIAEQAGFRTQHVAIEDIGIDQFGRYTDTNNEVIQAIFKLYPWEFMFDEEFGKALPNSSTLFFEPIWKSILSNKGILPLLWQFNKNHPNLLESHFHDGSAVGNGWVRKPLFSREGSNILVKTNDGTEYFQDGPYADSSCIIQKYHPLPCFDGIYTLIGSWVIGDVASGIGIREDDSIITKDTSRFVPHIIKG